jgi:hypothetical protein
VTGGLNLDPLTSAAMGSRPIEEPGWQRMADLPAYFNLADVMEQPLTDDNFSVQERVAHWIAALRMWERSPWLGIGLGNYALIYPAVRLPAWEEPLGHAHNIYLNVLAETGMVGLATYLLLGCGVVAWIWRRYRAAAAHSWNAALALGVLGVVAHFSVHNFFDNLLVQGMYLHLALWLALLVEPAAVRPELNRSAVRLSESLVEHTLERERPSKSIICTKTSPGSQTVCKIRDRRCIRGYHRLHSAQPVGEPVGLRARHSQCLQLYGGRDTEFHTQSVLDLS